MTQSELMTAIKSLPTRERLEVIEAAIHTLCEDLQAAQQNGRGEQMVKAAHALLQDYENNGELTSFSALDCETFHESR